MKNFLLKTTALSLILSIGAPLSRATSEPTAIPGPNAAPIANLAPAFNPAAMTDSVCEKKKECCDSVKLKKTFPAKKTKEMPPALRISGETSFNMYAVGQSETEGNKGKAGGTHFAMEDSRINFSIFGKTEQMGGLEYGALIALSGNPVDGNVQENRLKLKGEWGTLIGGNTRGVDDFMAVGAFSIMGGTGGFAGNSTNVLNTSTGVVVTTDLAGRPKDATKITYVTPRLNGFQAGISFTPSTAQKGDQKLATTTPDAKSLPFDHNQVGLGLNFRQMFGNSLTLKLSFTMLMGQTKPPVNFAADKFVPSYRNTKSHAIGGSIGYKDIEVGAEFIDNGDSQVALNGFGADGAYPLKGANAGKVASVAASYKLDSQNKVSIGFYNSNRCVREDYSNAKANIFSAAFDHKFAPGLSFGFEGNFFNMKTDDRAVADHNAYKEKAADLGLSKSDIVDGVKSNSGQVFIFNTKLKF